MVHERKINIGLFIAVCLLVMSCISQSSIRKENTAKVDSVFNYYFELIDLELSHAPIDSNTIDYYNIVDIGADTFYVIRDLPKAYSTLIDMSGIKVQHTDKNENMLLNIEIADSLKNWYIENRDNIVWDQRRNEPVLHKGR